MQQLFEWKMFFNKVGASICYNIFKDTLNCRVKYYSSTVQQSLVTKKSNADVQLLVDSAILHSYTTNADY